MSIAPTAAIDPYAFQTNDDLRKSLEICEYKCDGPTRLWHDSSGKGAGDDGSMSFADFLDIINPLQHLPVISTIYRAITGDQPGLVAELVGGALYGGPAGLLSAGVNAAIAGTTGQTDGQMLASVADAVFGTDGDEAPAAPATAVAAAEPPARPPARSSAQPQLAQPQLARALPDDPAPAPHAAPAPAPAGRPAHAAARPFTAFTAARAFPAFTADVRDFPARAGPAASIPGAASDDPESRRIADSVATQQRAQLGLLMANTGGSAAGQAATVAPAAGPPGLAAPMPELPGEGPQNPYLPIASGGSITPAAMRAALDRYRHAIAGSAQAPSSVLSP